MATAGEIEDTTEINIKKLHNEMILKLSREISPDKERNWNEFIYLMKVYIKGTMLAASKSIFEICDELLRMGKISPGECKVLLEAFKTMEDKTCQDIILKYTRQITEIKNLQPQQRTISDSSERKTFQPTATASNGGGSKGTLTAEVNVAEVTPSVSGDHIRKLFITIVNSYRIGLKKIEDVPLEEYFIKHQELNELHKQRMEMYDKLKKEELEMSLDNGSLYVTFTFKSKRSLCRLWEMYQSGELRKTLQAGLISTYVLRRCELKSVKLGVYIAKENYTKALEAMEAMEISESKLLEVIDEPADVESKFASRITKRKYASKQPRSWFIPQESKETTDRNIKDSDEKLERRAKVEEYHRQKEEEGVHVQQQQQEMREQQERPKQISAREIGRFRERVKLSANPMVSFLRRAQIPIRIPGSKNCPHHHGMEVAFTCTDCDGELICDICVATIHNEHAVKVISTVVTEAKTAIQDFVNKTENTHLLELKEQVKSLDTGISKNKNHYQNVIAKIKKQNENLKVELDKHTDTMITVCRGCEKQNDITIKRHIRELQLKIKELEARLHQLKDTLESGTETQVYDTARDMLNDVTIPDLPLLEDVNFNRSAVLLDQLENILGPLNRVKRTPNELFVKYKLLNTFKHQWHITRMQTHSDVNKVWVKDGNSKLALLNNAGQVEKRIEMNDDIDDFCVIPTTDDIYFCSHGDSSVRKVTGDDTSTVLFPTNINPLSLCISADGSIQVGMKRQIVKYTQRGQTLRKSKEVEQAPVIRYPVSISQCPVTRNIAVVDWDRGDCGGDDKRHVSILSEELQLLCRYYGNDVEPFIPRDVSYSGAGDIYIADCNNNSIQQITGTGEFIQTVYSNTDESPYCLCVQSNGDIWTVFSDHSLAFGGKAVKVLQKH